MYIGRIRPKVLKLNNDNLGVIFFVITYTSVYECYFPLSVYRLQGERTLSGNELIGSLYFL